MSDRGQDPVDPSGQVSDESERVRAIAAFLRDQEERAQGALRGEARRERIRRIRRTSLIMTWIGVAYVWVGTPGWLTVAPPPEPTVEEESDALRFNVFLQTQRVEAYRMERGRLPYVLDEAGPRFRGMEYRRRDNRLYEIRGRSGRVELLYLSQQSPLSFVGEAAELVDEPSGGGAP